MSVKENIKVLRFDVNMDAVKEANLDSMLVESETQLAQLDYEYNGVKESIELRVCGEVKLSYNGELYWRRKDFPDGLLEFLRDNADSHLGENGFDILNNNWVSCIYTLNGEWSLDDFVCDGEFGDTEESIKDWLIDTVVDLWDD